MVTFFILLHSPWTSGFSLSLYPSWSRTQLTTSLHLLHLFNLNICCKNSFKVNNCISAILSQRGTRENWRLSTKTIAHSSSNGLVGVSVDVGIVLNEWDMLVQVHFCITRSIRLYVLNRWTEDTRLCDRESKRKEEERKRKKQHPAGLEPSTIQFLDWQASLSLPCFNYAI